MKRFLISLFSRRCPYCGSVELRGVGTRNSVEQSLLWIVHPYRCCLCGHHVFLFRWQSPIQESI